MTPKRNTNVCLTSKLSLRSTKKYYQLLNKLMGNNFVFSKKRCFQTFTLDTSIDICNSDSLNKFSCYKDIGTTSFTNGDATCQAMGGSLPQMQLPDQKNFLVTKFGPSMWTGMRTSYSTA